MGDEVFDEWRIKTAERLASIERSVKYIETHMTKMPETVGSHEGRIAHLEGGLDKLDRFVHTRAAYAAGVVATMITAIPYAYEWAKAALRG